MSKEEVIKALSAASGRYGEELVAMMEAVKVNGLKEITDETAAAYFEGWRKKRDEHVGNRFGVQGWI